MALSMAIPSQPDHLTQRIFSRHDQIPLQTDILWKIESGAVRTLTWSVDGTLICLGYWGQGDVVGYVLSRLQPYEIECLTSVEVSILPSNLWCQALDAIILHNQQAEQLLRISYSHPNSLRLWQFLVWLGQKFGRDIDAGRLIELKLTQQELAEAINITRVSVTRLLQQFESEGRLLRHQRRLVLC